MMLSFVLITLMQKIKKYRKRTNFRKPGNLMIKEILKQWDIKKRKSIMIGDKNTDLLAAKI